MYTQITPALVLVVTCINNRFISSCIKSISEHNTCVPCTVLLLLQNNVQVDFESYETPYTHIEVLKTPSLLPLSQARNRVLAHQPIDTQAWYMFPDDDSTFDSAFFERFASSVQRNTLIGVKGADAAPDTFFLKIPQTDRLASKNDYHFAISVNMIVSGRTVAQVGEFDQQMGVGCHYGAGEDNDYFFRCMAVEPFAFCPSLWTYHPLQNQKQLSKIPLQKLIDRYKSYGRGVVYMLKKHNMHKEAIRVILRGYAGAALCLCKLNPKMSLVYFLAANERFRTFVEK